MSSSPPPGPYQRGKGPPASPVSQRAFSTPFLPRLSAEPEKLPEIPALPLNFAPREKQKEKKQEQATLSADWEPRGSGAICGSICGGLGDADDRLVPGTSPPSVGADTFQLPGAKEAPGSILAPVLPSRGVLVTMLGAYSPPRGAGGSGLRCQALYPLH